MAEPTHISPEKICFGDLEIALLTERAAGSDAEDAFFMAKSIWYIDAYREIRSMIGRAKNVLEVGVFKGGSTVFLHKFFDAERVVGIEFNPLPPALLEGYRATTSGISIHYGVNQADRAKVAEIVETEFREPIDLVIDDASHLYEETKSAFETIFPYLRPGGIYVIEDWNWSHHPTAQQADHHLADHHSLTNLVFELVVAHASTGIIDHVCLASSMAWVRNSGMPLPKKGAFRLSEHLLTRKRPMPTI